MANEPEISQAELDAAIERAEDAEARIDELEREARNMRQEIKDLEDKLHDAENAEPEYEHYLTTPIGGTIGYAFEEKCTMQDEMIFEALQTAYEKVGAANVLACLEYLGK